MTSKERQKKYRDKKAKVINQKITIKQIIALIQQEKKKNGTKDI